ncbi:Vacuolar protein sorting-associated protein atg6 [Dionaea muscipula]
MMEESFVVLPSAPISDGGGTQVPFAEAGTDSHLHPNSLGFHSTITVLKRSFELATTQTQGVLSTRAAVCADNLRAKRDDNPCEGSAMSDCESVDETLIEDSATLGHPFQ